MKTQSDTSLKDLRLLRFGELRYCRRILTKGRPRGSRSSATLLREILSEQVQVRENGSTRRVTKKELLLRNTVIKAVTGDPRAREFLFNRASWRRRNLPKQDGRTSLRLKRSKERGKYSAARSERITFRRARIIILPERLMTLLAKIGKRVQYALCAKNSNSGAAGASGY